MNFLIIHFKNGQKVYFNITTIAEMATKQDKSITVMFTDGEHAIYGPDRDPNYDKWELI